MSPCYVYHVTIIESQWKLTQTVYHHTHWRYDTHIVGPYDQYDRYIAVSLHLYQSNILITANDDNEYLMRVNTLYS